MTGVSPDEYLVNRLGEYMGDSYTVVWCPSRDAAEAARRLLAGECE